MKKYVKCSYDYEDRFWDLHDSGQEVGIALEDIIEEKGLTSRFFPDDGEPTADEADYREVLNEYEARTGRSSKVTDINNLVSVLANDFEQHDDIRLAYWDDSVGAIRVKLSDGHCYQFVLQDLGNMF